MNGKPHLLTWPYLCAPERKIDGGIRQICMLLYVIEYASEYAIKYAAEYAIEYAAAEYAIEDAAECAIEAVNELYGCVCWYHGNIKIKVHI